MLKNKLNCLCVIITFCVLTCFLNELQSGSYKPVESLYCTLGITTGYQTDDLMLVKRIINAYQHAGKSSQHRGNSMWQLFFDQRHTDIHSIFINGNVNAAADILRNPHKSDLFYGFDNLCRSILGQFASLDVKNRKESLDSVLQIAEMIGVVHTYNPEGRGYSLDQGSIYADDILQRIQQQLNAPISFPNPYPFEYGLLTSYGIVSYRAIQALYQAVRIKELIKDIPNPRILEIGAGLGRTAQFARQLGIQDNTI